jgi:hypothetical protein
MEQDARRCILVIAVISIVFFVVEGGASLAFGWFSVFFDALKFFERAVVLSILSATPLWSLGARYTITSIIVLPCLILLTTGAYLLGPGFRNKDRCRL